MSENIINKENGWFFHEGLTMNKGTHVFSTALITTEVAFANPEEDGKRFAAMLEEMERTAVECSLCSQSYVGLDDFFYKRKTKNGEIKYRRSCKDCDNRRRAFRRRRARKATAEREARERRARRDGKG